MFPTANTTLPTASSALSKVAAIPLNLMRTTRNALASVNPFRFSFAQAAHVRLKVDSMAMVLFCIAKQLWAYVEGWRDSRRERRRNRNMREERMRIKDRQGRRERREPRKVKE